MFLKLQVSRPAKNSPEPDSGRSEANTEKPSQTVVVTQARANRDLFAGIFHFHGPTRRQWLLIVGIVLTIACVGIKFFIAKLEQQEERNQAAFANLEYLLLQMNDPILLQAGYPLEIRHKIARGRMEARSQQDPADLQKDLTQYTNALPDNGNIKYKEMASALAKGELSKLKDTAREAADFDLKHSQLDYVARRKRLMQIAAVLISTYQVPEALEVLHEARRITSPDSEPQVWANISLEIAGCLFGDGRLLEAEPVMRELVHRIERTPSANPEDVRLSQQLFAVTLNIIGKTEEALRYQESTWTIRNRRTVANLNDLAGSVLSVVNAAIAEEISWREWALIGWSLKSHAHTVLEKTQKAEQPPDIVKSIAAAAFWAIVRRFETASDILTSARAELAKDDAAPPGLRVEVDYFLAVLLLLSNNLEAAESVTIEALARAEALPAGRKLLLAAGRLLHANILIKCNRQADAVQELKQARQESISCVGSRSFITAAISSDLADLLVDLDRRREAESLLREMVSQPDPPNKGYMDGHLLAMLKLGELLQNDKRPEEAKAIYNAGLKIFKRNVYKDPVLIGLFYEEATSIAEIQEAYVDIVALTGEGLSRLESIGDHSSRMYRLLLRRRATALFRLKQYREAADTTGKLIAALDTFWSPNPEALNDAVYDHAWYLLKAKDYAASESGYRRALAFYASQPLYYMWRIAAIRREMAELLLIIKRSGESEEQIRSALTILRQSGQLRGESEASDRFKGTFLNVRKAQGESDESALAEWKRIIDSASVSGNN